MKRISRFLGLKKTQAELDFVDIEVGSDTPLFLDPAAFHEGKGGFARECAADIEEFFDAVLDAAGEKNWAMGMELLRGLQEPDEIQFGFSYGKPRGRGIGQEQASQIFRAILKSKAIQSGMIQDLNDAFMFIPGIGPDKVSDITANIIRKHLITYTQNQFALYGVDIPNKYPTGLMWDSLNRCWYEEHDYIPFYKGQKVLLVPKWYVKYHYDFTKLGRRYYDGFIASFVRDRELSTMGKLVSFIPRKNSPPTPHVYKHDIEREIPRNKDSIVDFTQKHPDVYRKFRDAMLKHNPMSINALVNAQGKNFREMEFSNSSIEALRNIPTGNRSANDYQSLIVGLIHFLLYRQLYTLLSSVIDVSGLQQGRSHEHQYHQPHLSRRSQGVGASGSLALA